MIARLNAHTDVLENRQDPRIARSREAVQRAVLESLRSGRDFGSLTVSEVEDLAGNRLQVPFVSTFRTSVAADMTPPEIVAATPPDGARDVPFDTDVVVRFSEALDSTSVDATSFSLRQTGAGAVGGTIKP